MLVKEAIICFMAFSSLQSSCTIEMFTVSESTLAEANDETNQFKTDFAQRARDYHVINIFVNTADRGNNHAVLFAALVVDLPRTAGQRLSKVAARKEQMTNTYISPSKTFSFEYADNWKLLRNDDGSILLWKKGGLLKKDSQYILRIVPLLSEIVISPETYQIYVDYRKKEHVDLQVIDKSESHVMNFHIIKYRHSSFQDAETKTVPAIQDCWELVLNNRIFKCSFTVTEGAEDSPRANEERAAAERILQSLRLL